ncbi:MAG: hypothetical protein GTO41_05205, partial [Burkholderiales bacterium]|nr:hypothetical protein [Burkholderiales bacterium]
LPGHFPGDPVVPGVVLLDEILDAVYREFAAPADAAVVTIRSAKFLRPVQPGEDLNIELRAGDEAVVNFICRVGNETAVKGSLLLNRPGQQ